jgi:hypothetical protein
MYRFWLILPALVLLLAACGQTPEPPTDDLLRYVPDDSPYAFVANHHLPDGLRERLADHAARELSLQRAVFQDVLRRADDAPDAIDRPPEFEGILRVVDAILMEFEGRDSAAAMRELGLEPSPRAVYFGLGLLPAARIEIADADALEAMLDRIEARGGLSARRGDHAGQGYRRIDLGRVDLVLAVTPDELIVGLLADSLFERDLPLLLGQEPPGKSLAADGRMADLEARHGLTGYGIGFVDLEAIVATLLGRVDGRSAETFRALGGTLAQIPDGCAGLVEGLVGGMPRVAVGISEANAQRLAIRGVWEVAPAVGNHLARLAAPVPGVGIPNDGMLSLGLGLDLPQVRTAIEVLLRYLADHGGQCPWIQPASLQAIIPQLNLALGPMTAGLKGLHLRLDDLDFDVERMRPAAAEASLLLAVDDPRGVFALATMFNPALATLDLPADGSLIDLPGELVPDRETPPMKVALGDRRLLLVSGADTAADAPARLAAALAQPPVMFSLDYGLANLVERLGGPWSEAVQRLAAYDEPELAAELEAQFDDFRRQSELFERVELVVRGEADGLVSEQVMWLR